MKLNECVGLQQVDVSKGLQTLKWCGMVLAWAALLSACASSPSVNKARMTLTASADVNPAVDGRPSPLVIRVFQLAEDAKFNNADFFALFDDEQRALGADLLAREEVELVPGERRTVSFIVAGETKFVGVLAAYRDIRNARWRAVQAAPKKGLLNYVKRDAIQIKADRTAVMLTVGE